MLTAMAFEFVRTEKPMKRSHWFRLKSTPWWFWYWEGETENHFTATWPWGKNALGACKDHCCDLKVMGWNAIITVTRAQLWLCLSVFIFLTHVLTAIKSFSSHQIDTVTHFSILCDINCKPSTFMSHFHKVLLKCPSQTLTFYTAITTIISYCPLRPTPVVCFLVSTRLLPQTI